MIHPTGSRSVVCNVWSDAAREASAEARRSRSIHQTKSQIAGKLVDTEGNPVGDADEFDVYHATSPDVADKLVSEGFHPGSKVSRGATKIDSETVAKALGKRVGDALDYEPGRGLGGGLYVGPNAESLSHYGNSVVAIRVKKSDLSTSPERSKVYGMTPTKSLLLDDGYLGNEIPASRFRRVR